MVAKKGQGKRWQTRNRTNPNTNTPSQQRARANAAIDGRTANAAYSSGAKTVPQYIDMGNGHRTQKKELDIMRDAWQDRSKVTTYTKTKDGLMSVNGKNTKGAVTHAMTPKNDDGSPVLNDKGEVRQSGRNGQLANRRQRDYDNRKAMNNISPRVIEAWLRTGLAREVNGQLVGEGGNIIRQQANGTYSMGLSTG